MRDGPPELPDADAVPPAELMAWLSPVFPTGGFAYSQGLELACERGWVRDRDTLEQWLAALIDHGALRNDLILISLVHRASGSPALHDLAELAAALQPSRERAEDALVQGRSFAEAYEQAWAAHAPAPGDWLRGIDPHRLTLPIAYGLALRAYALPLAPALVGFAMATLNNAVSAAIRLSATGQYDGQRVLAALLPRVRRSCAIANAASMDDLGSATFAADLASLLHETQATRLFRS
jgi:urease accessory protein